MLTAEELQAIRERAERATKGPWTTDGISGDHYDDCECVWVETPAGKWNPGGRVRQSRAGCANCEAIADAKFIAAAREDVPRLLAHIEALEAEIREAKAAARYAIEGAWIDGCPIAVDHVQMACGALFDAGRQIEEAEEDARQSSEALLAPILAVTPAGRMPYDGWLNEALAERDALKEKLARVEAELARRIAEEKR